MDRAQHAQKRICADFLHNDELLHNQSGLCYHYQPQLLSSNPGQLCCILLAVMDQAQFAQKRIYVAFLLNDKILRNQLGL